MREKIRYWLALVAALHAAPLSAQTIGGYVPTGTGTVTSVAVGAISGVTTAGAPVTASGTLTQTLTSQSANTVLAAPNGSSGAPTFRSLVAADLPTLNQNTTGTAANVTGIVALANGGAGANISSVGQSYVNAGPSGSSGAPTFRALAAADIPTIGVGGGGTGLTAAPANGALLIGNGTNYTSATITAGPGVTVTNSAGAVSIGSSSGGGYSGLKIVTQGISNYTSVISANYVAVSNGTNTIKVNSVNVSCVLTASGANGLDTGALGASNWYFIYVIYNSSTTTTACLASLSTAAPTMPGTYTYFRRVGAIRTDASGSKYLLQTLQYGPRAQWVLTAGSNLTALPSIITGAVGSPTTPTLVAESTASVAPSTASAIGVIGYTNAGGTVAEIIVAPNAYYGSVTSANPAPISLYFNYAATNEGAQSAWFNLESANIWYASSATATGVNCLGWEDNL